MNQPISTRVHNAQSRSAELREEYDAPVAGRSPTLFEHVQSVMNSEYNKHFDFLRNHIITKVNERATERKLWVDLKKLVGSEFRVEIQPEVVRRVVQWLQSEGFTDVKTVKDKNAENAAKPANQRFNVHNTPYKNWSVDTVLLEW